MELYSKVKLRRRFLKSDQYPNIDVSSHLEQPNQAIYQEENENFSSLEASDESCESIAQHGTMESVKFL